MASISSDVTFRGSLGDGRRFEPSKNPHRRLACIASRNRTAKIAQLEPSGSSRGMLEGSCSTKGVGAGGADAGADEAEGTVDDEAGGADEVVGADVIAITGG